MKKLNQTLLNKISGGMILHKKDSCTTGSYSISCDGKCCYLTSITRFYYYTEAEKEKTYQLAVEQEKKINNGQIEICEIK